MDTHAYLQRRATEQRIEVLWESGLVKRLHTVSTLRQQTVAEHVYGAQIIARELCALNGVDPGPVLLSLLLHDSAELETGDAPAPVKRANKEVQAAYDAMEEAFAANLDLQHPALTDQQHAIMKAGDYLDLAFTALHERRMGNHHPRTRLVFQNVTGYTEELDATVRGVRELREYVRGQWAMAGAQP